MKLELKKTNDHQYNGEEAGKVTTGNQTAIQSRNKHSHKVLGIVGKGLLMEKACL